LEQLTDDVKNIVVAFVNEAYLAQQLGVINTFKVELDVTDMI
jgi:hypothetical protein